MFYGTLTPEFVNNSAKKVGCGLGLSSGVRSRQKGCAKTNFGVRARQEGKKHYGHSIGP